MQLIFIPDGSSEDLMNMSMNEIESDEFELIKEELTEIDSRYRIEEVNLGTGADWIAILAIINSITSILKLSRKAFNEN